MKSFILVLVALCFVQPGVVTANSREPRFLSMPQADISKALSMLNTAFKTLDEKITGGQKMISEYRDNATNYADQFKKLQQEQIDGVAKLMDVAIAEAQSQASTKDAGVLACFANKRAEVRDVAVGLAKDAVRCPATKVSQIGDIALDMTRLANTSINIIPDAGSKMSACTKLSLFEQPGCIIGVTTTTTQKILQTTLDVSKTVIGATTLFINLPSDLHKCMDVKMLNFRLKASHIPVEIGMCTGKSILG